MGAAAVAIILRREREIIERFTRAGATSPETAQTLAALGVDERLAFRRLRERAVIRESGLGVWYLDQEVWHAVRRGRRRVAILMLLIVGILAIATALGLLAGSAR